MPINLQKLLRKDAPSSVESLLDSAKAKLLEQLTDADLLKAWTLSKRSGWLLPTEPFSHITTTLLFPLAVKFCGEPVNDATHYTARRALRNDYEKFMALLKKTEPTAEEQQTYKEISCP